MGKIYQRLGEHDSSFQCFKRAHVINPEQVDVAREAGLAALDIGDPQEALSLCRAAVALAPNDPGLVANLAWAHVISGDLETALQTIRQAIEADPADKISLSIQRLITQMMLGEKPIPKRLSEIVQFG